jgi:hypothetical protein
MIVVGGLRRTVLGIACTNGVISGTGTHGMPTMG